MTILNAVIQGPRAYIITDQAWMAPDGTLAGVASKFITGTSYPLLMAVTGNMHPVGLAAYINKAPARSGRQLVEALPGILRSAVAEAPELDAGIAMAIWDKRIGQPLIYVTATTDNQFPGTVAPFEIVALDGFWGGTLTPTEALGRPVDIRDPQSFDAYTDGADFVEAQRKAHRFENQGAPAYRIGGGVEVGTLTRKGATLRTVREWPGDTVGQLIEPFAGNTVAASARVG